MLEVQETCEKKRIDEMDIVNQSLNKLYRDVQVYI